MVTKAGRGSEQFMLRLPDGMRDRIRAAAEANARSMNAEIVSTLERAYPGNRDINESAAEIARLANAIKSEKDSNRRAELRKEMRDMNSVLQHELNQLLGPFSVEDDEDYIPHLR
ncbi:Arc family DNA-binding protein [Salipiger bermudensis]|uniref:Arc family DNA-binding protein n=1 Tax=Salipiger bermudensis TaxID=344736 RepID=UPI003516010C